MKRKKLWCISENLWLHTFAGPWIGLGKSSLRIPWFFTSSTQWAPWKLETKAKSGLWITYHRTEDVPPRNTHKSLGEWWETYLLNNLRTYLSNEELTTKLIKQGLWWLDITKNTDLIISSGKSLTKQQQQNLVEKVLPDLPKRNLKCLVFKKNKTWDMKRNRWVALKLKKSSQ